MRQSNSITYYLVDAFTGFNCLGNPAAVFVLEKPLNNIIMQIIAEKINLSETAFDLRWFTPTTEVDLCGHATLATARVLYDIHNVPAGTIAFHTKSGKLEVSRSENYIRMDFPSGDPQPIHLPKFFMNALGLDKPDLADSFFEALQCQRTGKLLIRLKTVEDVKNIAPDFEELRQAEEDYGSRGVIVTAMGDEPYDFTSRFFCPGMGIDEDPVTGAAHAILAPYWSIMLDKKKMSASQASARGGEMLVEIRKSPKGRRNRVFIYGKAIITKKAQYELEIDDD
jgi:PhzF family phenazine biosynthesis protein